MRGAAATCSCAFHSALQVSAAQGTANTPDDQFRVDGVDLDNVSAAAAMNLAACCTCLVAMHDGRNAKGLCDCVQVTLVGRLISMQEQATNLTLVLDDGTGQVELKYWIDSDEIELVCPAATHVGMFAPALQHGECMLSINAHHWFVDVVQLQQRKAECRVGVYVRVHGHMREFNGERGIIAFSIRPVTDYNEASQATVREAIVQQPPPVRTLTHEGHFQTCGVCSCR
jgi:hypothetical protein